MASRRSPPQHDVGHKALFSPTQGPQDLEEGVDTKTAEQRIVLPGECIVLCSQRYRLDEHYGQTVGQEAVKRQEQKDVPLVSQVHRTTYVVRSPPNSIDLAQPGTKKHQTG